MEVQNINDDKRGLFFIEGNGKRIGKMYYTFTGPGKMTIDHTEVDDAYEGKGLGRQLVKAGVLYARENDLKFCRFARSPGNYLKLRPPLPTYFINRS